MAEITYTVTTEQMNEIKAALQFHQGLDSTPSDADVKAWGLRHFQGLVQKHRQSVIDAANPPGTTAIAT
tara:strand:- start:636 stop:842 length:207 start_codon:yes stop_codon:yes gene_type:complete